jgi:hypothetical protein
LVEVQAVKVVEVASGSCWPLYMTINPTPKVATIISRSACMAVVSMLSDYENCV